MKDLAEPVHVRLPIEVMKALEAESNRDGIPVSALVRRAVLREYRLSEGDGNPDYVSGKTARAPLQRATGENVTAREEVSA